MVEIGWRHARAAVLDRQADTAWSRYTGADSQRRTGRRVIGDVVEDVRDDRIEQHGIDADQRQTRRHIHRDRPTTEDRPETRHRPLHELWQIEYLEVGS